MKISLVAPMVQWSRYALPNIVLELEVSTNYHSARVGFDSRLAHMPDLPSFHH